MMLRRGMIGIAALAALLCIAAGAGAVEIARVEVVGNHAESTQKILSVFGLRAGDELRPDRVSLGLQQLFQTKNFSDLSASYRMEGDKAVVVLTVVEYRRVKEVRIQGFDKLKREDIEGKVSLKEGYFARPTFFTQDASAIRALYAEKGYNRARVDVRQIPDDKNYTVAVVYRIEEGVKVSIHHMDFLGNGALESRELRKVMESKEDRWWRGGDYKPAVLEEDLKKITELYNNRGYLDASAMLERQVEVKEGKGIDLYFRVNEGKRYTVGTVTWTGNSVVHDDDIRPLVNIKEGEPFALDRIDMLMRDINSLYYERGYIWARLMPERKVKEERIDLSLRFVENNAAAIREVNINGNTKTFEPLIRREFRALPGDTFVLSTMQRGLREIVSLGYFNSIPQINISPVAEGGDIDLDITVEEKQTGYFRFGTGFSQLNSLSGFFGISENNLFGRGKSVSLDWEFGKWRQNVNFQYMEPYFLGTQNNVTVSLYNWIQDRVQQQYYTDRRKGASVQIGRPFGLLDYARVFSSYRIETVSLSNFSIDYPEFGVLRTVDWPLRKSSLMLGFSRNSTDEPRHPTRGSIASVSAELTGGLLGGNVKYMRYMAGMDWFRTIFWKFTFHLNMEAGVVDGYDSPDQVQDFEKFRLGGNRRYALRGYDFFEVVPEGNDEFVGGRFMTTFTHEILFPFSNAVYGLVFFDAGNTWNSFGEADLFNMRRGLGLGVRIEVPTLGNLGFDYGYGFDKPGGPGWEPHFTFGSFF